MAKLIIKKSLLDEKEILLEKETAAETLSLALYNCREVKGFFVIAKVNHVLIPPDDWHLFKLNTFDRIELTARPEKGVLPYIGMVIGAVIGAVAGFASGGPVGAFWGGLEGAMIGYSLGSVADSLFYASAPNVPLYIDTGTAESNPNYGWDGARLVTQPGGPKTILYGQHRISGALIMQYISTDGDKNYLNMLINLGQGEIDGVMRSDGTGVCTSNVVTPATTSGGNINVADVDGNYHTFPPPDVDTGTFSSLPTGTKYLVVNGYMKGGLGVVGDYDTTYYQVRVRPVLYYRFGGAWYSKAGAYQWIQDNKNYSFQIAVSKTNLLYSDAVIDAFYVQFDYLENAWQSPLAGGKSYSGSIGGYINFYSFMHLTTYSATSYAYDAPDVELNGMPFRYFENITWNYRLGTYNQTVIPGFNQTQTFYDDGRKIETAAITYVSTGVLLDGFEVQMTCPSLFQQDAMGNIVDNSVQYKIEYQIVGAGSWTNGGTYTITGASKTTLYDYHEFSNLTQGQYNIRITRLSPLYTSFKKGGDLHLGGVTEITYENIAYRNSALLSLKVQASEQLSNTTPNVTALVRGIKVLVPKLTISGTTQTYDDCYWDDDAGAYKRTVDDETCTDTGEFVRQWTRNPIWCTRDFILNKRYGLGNYIDSDSFNDTAAAIEAKYCWEMVTDFDGGTEHRFEIDIPISSYMSAQEALRMLQRCFRGWIIYSNGMYKPVIDRATDAVQIFNGSNVKPGSLKTTYLKASQIPNVVEIQFADPDRSYNIEPFEIADEDEWTEAKPRRSQSINAIGTVRKSQNIRDGRYFLNCAKHVGKIPEFIAAGDAIHCEPGDTVRLQDDLLAWGVGGRVVSAGASSITANIDITYTVDYEVRVRLPDYTLETRTVSSVTNNGRTINVSAPFTETPLVDSVFTYGASGVDSKPFKVKNITRMEGDDKEREWYRLTVAEENSNKYNDTDGVSLPDPKYTELINPAEIPGPVINLTLTEMANQPGFYVAFNIPQRDFSFHHADVFLSLDNSNWWLYKSNIASRSNLEVLGVKPGQIYYAKVISYNRFGAANLSPATANITITETNFIPPNVNGLRLDAETPANTTIFTKKDAKFTWRKTSVTSGAGNLPAGQENLGAGSYIDDVKYKYIVEIYVGGSRVRKEVVSDNAYVYTYEKNASDNAGTAVNSFTLMVWAYNEDANIKSINPITLSVTNTAPAAVSGLSATPWMEGVKFYWQPNTEIDIASYYLTRTKVSTGDWSEWENFEGTSFLRFLTEAEVTAYGSDATIYFEIKAIDTFGNMSGAVGANAACLSLNIQESDISDFAITASKIFTKIPILSGDSWTDDSPSANYVAWNEHTIYYNGTAYTIASGNTNLKYIYWENGASSYSASDTNPTLADGDFIIATNIDGAHDLAWNAIANQVIGSAYIQNLAVLDAHIANLSVSKLTAGTITSKVIVLDVAGGSGDAAIRAGKTDFTNTESGFILGIDDSDDDKAKFYIGGTDSYLNWTGSSLAIRVSGGDAIKLIGADSNYSTIKFLDSAETVGFRFYANAAGSSLWINTIDTGTHQITIGDSYVNLLTIHGLYIDVSAIFDSNNYAIHSLRGVNGNSYFQWTLNISGTSRYIQFRNTGILLSSHKYFNFGEATVALDNIYADDFVNVADFYHLDTKDDIEAIRGIKGSGVFDKKTGLELIDDNTLPKWLCGLNDEGEIERDPDGKPYIPLKIGISLSWGAIRQIDNMIRNLCLQAKIDYASIKQ